MRTKSLLIGLACFIAVALILSVSGKSQRQEQGKASQISKGDSSDTATQETYVSQVIISTPWAEKNLVYDGEESSPGEFGLETFIFQDDSLREELPDPPLPEGPTSFTVAPNGDIYITDPLNKRIQRFDANGNFISIIPIPPLEKGEYLHIQQLPELSDSARMEMLRRAGKLPKDGKVPPKPKTPNGYQYVWSLICVDRYNNVYLLWWGDYTKQTLCKYDPQGNLMATYPFFPEVRIGGGANKLYCDSSDRLFFQYSRRLTDRIILSLKEWDSLRGTSAPFAFQIGTSDRVFTFEEQKAALRRGVLHETTDTRKIKEQAWKEFSGKFWGLHSMWDYDFVDEKGNLYHFCSTKEGIIITKWYKP
jgi:hypothetical protein